MNVNLLYYTLVITSLSSSAKYRPLRSIVIGSVMSVGIGMDLMLVLSKHYRSISVGIGSVTTLGTSIGRNIGIGASLVFLRRIFLMGLFLCLLLPSSPLTALCVAPRLSS